MAENQLEIPRATGKGRPNDSNCNIALFGDHGGGKTTWAEEILLANRSRLLIIDTPMKEYGHADFCKATGVKYDAVLDSAEALKDFLTSKNCADPKVGYRVVVRAAGREEDIFRLFAVNDQIGRSPLTDSTFAVDEIHRHMDKDNISVSLANHLAVGRHNRNNLIGISQVPKKQTNNLYQAGMDMFISFRQTQDSAIDFFAEFSREKALQLAHLERGDFRLFRGSPEQLLEFIRG